MADLTLTQRALARLHDNRDYQQLVSFLEERLVKDVETNAMRWVNDTPTMVDHAVNRGRIEGIREVFRIVKECHQKVISEKEV